MVLSMTTKAPITFTCFRSSFSFSFYKDSIYKAKILDLYLLFPAETFIKFYCKYEISYKVVGAFISRPLGTFIPLWNKYYGCSILLLFTKKKKNFFIKSFNLFLWLKITCNAICTYKN